MYKPSKTFVTAMTGPSNDSESNASKEPSLPKWNLNDLYSGSNCSVLKADLTKAQELSAEFSATYAGKLPGVFEAGSEAVHTTISSYERIVDLIDRISTFVFLHYCEDTGDTNRSRFYGDYRAHLAEVLRNLLFFPLELNKIDENRIESVFSHPDLAPYRNWMKDLRAEKPHQLDETIEQLMHEKELTGSGAWVRLFDQSLGALRVKFDGESKPLEPVLSMLSSPDPEKRSGAAHALIATFEDNVDNFGTIFNVLMQDKAIDDRWRSFPSPSASRHLDNRIEPEVVETMVSAVREAYPKLSHRYYRLKAQWMGMDKLNFWDRNAPLTLDDDQTFSFEKAKSIVLDAYGEFSEQMREIANRFFTERWIDAPTSPGKMSGAFSHPCATSVHPYILLNYQGKARDVMTLAHELGHGVHQVLAAETGPLLASTPLTLAETASVFGEMLTFRSLLSAATTKQEKRTLIVNKVEDNLNTVTRQVSFYLFEQKLHAERVSGEVSTQRIGEIWLETQGEALGNSVLLNPGYETFWCYVPHFIHSPFYVYAYAFGDCLVNSLYARYASGHSDFGDKYLALLKAGGSKPYHEALAPFGLDLKDPSFWLEGINTISDLIAGLEQEDE